jgi:hypothetical protein
MFLLIAILSMAGLAALNYRVSRSLRCAPALLAEAWTVLPALLASGEMYCPISPETMWVVPAQTIIVEAVYA